MNETFNTLRVKLANQELNLDEVDAALGDLHASVTRADALVQESRARLEELRADLQALEGLRGFLAHDPSSSTVQAERSTPTRARSGSKREGILSVLEDGQELHTRAIRQLLVDAGEMNADQGSYHTLQVILSQMYRAGELIRPARGVYGRLPASTGGDSGSE